MVVTQNGEVRLVVQDIASVRTNSGDLGIVKVLALGNRQVEQGRVVSASEALAGIREANLANE